MPDHASPRTALFRDGYYYSGVIEETRGVESVKVAWDDGDTPSWVDAGQVVLAYRQPALSDLEVGSPVLALYSGLCETKTNELADIKAGGGGGEKGAWFSAEVVELPREGRAQIRLKWEDGSDEFSAEPQGLRTFLTPLNPSRSI